MKQSTFHIAKESEYLDYKFSKYSNYINKFGYNKEATGALSRAARHAVNEAVTNTERVRANAVSEYSRHLKELEATHKEGIAKGALGTIGAAGAGLGLAKYITHLKELAATAAGA